MSDTLASIFARLQVINASISATKRALTYPPQRAPGAADLPLMYTRWIDSPEAFIIGESYSKSFWRVELVVLVEAVALGTMDEHMAELIKWPERIRDAYAGRILLNDDDGVSLLSGSVSIESIGPCRNEPVIIGETAYSAVHCDLVLKDHTSVTVSA